MADKVVTVQDYLIKKDPEKYEKLLSIKKKSSKKEITVAALKNRIEVLEDSIKNLVKENKSLAKEIDEIAEENTALKEQLLELTTIGGEK